MTEEQVFLAALDLPDETAHGAYLDETCGENAELRQQVEALLAAHFQSGEFMDVPAPEQISVEPGLSHAVTIASNVMPAARNADDESESLEFLAPPSRPDSLGRIDHYEILQVLGKGGFGIVFRAFDDVLQRVVAIKMMAPQMAATSPARKRFLREARTSAQVRHENVVQVYEVGEQPLPYLVMEFIPGETLQQRIDRMGPLDVPETLRIGRQIAEGLAAAHAMDLIHRDIKPGNVLLEGGQHKVKITDFGLARAADDASVTQSGQIAGTPMYMAPEQALGETLDQRADLFSLGSVLYQMVAGRAPFRANTAVAVLKRVAEDTPRNIREIIPETPQWLCDIIAKLHAKDPDKRFQSAREVADVLADCEAQLKANSRLKDYSRIPRVQPQPSPHRRSLAVATAIFVLLALALASPFLYRYATNQSACNLIYSGAIDPNLDDILIKRDGQVVAKLLTSHGIVHLPAGDYEAEVVCRDGYELATYRRGPFSVLGDTPGALGWKEAVGETIPLTLTRDWDVGISLKLAKLTADPSNAPRDELGWVQLFNGQDLSGWQTIAGRTADWTVKDGVLTGRGPVQNYLYSTKGDYRDFHLRAEARINDGGNSGIHFRVTLPDAKVAGAPPGYEVQIAGPADVNATGSLMIFPAKNYLLAHVAKPLVPANTWFTQEIIARGRRIIVKVNDQLLVDQEHTGPQIGHLALQAFEGNTKVDFRKIEIKELPPEEPGWVQLFNGKDLSGWKTHPEHAADWRVADGIMTCRGPKSHLFSKRGDYRDFQLRFEWRASQQEADSGVYFRCDYSINRGFPPGYELNLGRGEDGSLMQTPPTQLGGNRLVASRPIPSEANQWRTGELTVVGQRLTASIDGNVVVEFDQLAPSRPFGHIALEHLPNGNPACFVEFRKIEIKELPPNSIAKQEPLPPTHKNTIGMEFVIVPKGKSWLGGSKDRLGDQEVEIPADLYLGKYEVTQEQWEKVMGENPSHFSRNGDGKDVVKDITDEELKRFAVENVTWNQCQIFVAKLNKLEKEAGWVYRLPKEAEWEYACRGGPMADKLDSAFDFYFAKPTNAMTSDQANFAGTEWMRTSKVGSFKSNGLGLCDMHGNVWEWCDDEVKYAPDHPLYYQGASQRLHRGGGWQGGSEHGAAANRAAHVPSYRDLQLGLRLARVPSGAPSPEVKTPPIAKTEPQPPTHKNSIGMEFVIVPKGKSWLGGGKDKLGDKEVEIPADFYLGKYEVTQEEWEKVMGENPSWFSRTGGGKDAVKDIPDADLKRFPVEMVTWDQCQVFVAKLNRLEKETGWVYRLPKELEWEYACRGGPMANKADSAVDFYFAKPTNTLTPDQANFGGRFKRPCKVGEYEANRLGLFDMHGNVTEWCDDKVDGAPAYRGGGWAFAYQRECRAAVSNPHPPRGYSWHNGLRLARVPSAASSPEAKKPPLAASPFTDADVQRIAALPAEQQVAAVVASLKERNPGLNGTASHKIVDGVVTEFNFNPTDDQNALTDVSPVRALAGLTSLNLWNCSALADLGPLQGLPLTRLLIGSLDVSNQVRDLKPLQGMRLTELQLYQCQVEDLKPLAGMPLTRLRIYSRQVRDCEPLKGMPLTTLDLSYCAQIQDFTPLTGLPLTGLHLNACQIRDLQPLLGLKLTEVSLAGTRVQDLQQLKGMPLTNLAIHRTGVTDLTPLQGMELKEIFLTPKNITQGLNHLRDMQSLNTIGIGYTSNEKWPAVEFWDRYDKEEFAPVPFTEADAKRIAALPAAEQVEEVRKELIKRNPGFDGVLEHKIEEGAVTELHVNTDEVFNIAPVRALMGLVYLDCRGTYPNKGKLSDLSPLKGTTISRIDCSSTQVGDLTPLSGLPLTYLHFNHNPVSDLTPLKGMPLLELGLAETKVSDLSPLKGMKLQVLGAQLVPVTDLSPLAGMPLKGLDLYGTIGVTSLEPLRGMPLEGLNLQDLPVSDLSPLAGMTTLRSLLLQGNKVTDLTPLKGLKLTDLLLMDEQISDLSPLQGMPLIRLHIHNTSVSDLTPLQGMPLQEIRLAPQNITQGLDILKGINSLKTIGTGGNQAWPPVEFWERLDKGEFK